jgi:TolB-like protein
VLPFANMSGDSDQEYFADGMVEEIITALSRVRWIFVILRLDQRLVHRRHNRQLRHAEFGHVGVRAAVGVRVAGLPERSALALCQRTDRQAGLQ